jgi:hypothetical protein
VGEAFISKRRHIGIAIETTKGTAETLVAGDYAIMAYDIQAVTQFGRFDRDTQKAYLTKLPGIVGTTACQISFTCEVRHSANATTLDVWERALQGCGFALSTSTLKPTSNGDEQKTLTIEVALGAFGTGSNEAVIFKAKGCAGTVTFEGRVGQPLLARFTFTGVYDGVASGTLQVPTQETGIPGVFQGVSATWGGSARILSTVNLDVGNSVVLRESVNASSGLLHAVIVDRRPTGSIDPDLELVATEDFYGQQLNNTSKAFAFAVTTGGSSRVQTFTLADCRVTNVNDANRNGIQVAGLDFEIVDTSDTTTPDEDIKIVLS